GQEYEYADFHVFTVVEGDSTDICKSQLPINVNNQDNDALFCEQSAGVVRAVFDWKNRSSQPDNYGARLSWLNTITQFGSRAQGNVACGAAGETVSGRCANQLADGFRAFGDMAGPGGVAIVDLDISNLTSLNAMFVRAGAFNENIGAWDTSAITDMGYIFNTAKSFNQDISGWNTGSVTRMKFMFFSAQSFNQPLAWNTSNVLDMSNMFKDARVFNQDISSWDTGNVTNMGEMFKEAKAFDQDLSGWNVKEVEDYSDFDTTTDAWCGLGFDNRGRPSDWVPTDTVGCLNVVLQAPLSSSVGDEFDYVVQYYNQSERDLINGALTLVVPAGMTISDAGNGSINGSQVTWAGVDVLAGSSADGAGGERRVGVTVDAGTADGAALEASATLSDGAATTVNDIARTVISAKPVLITQISASQQVAPGEVIQYALSVSNEGQSTATGGEVTLSWEGDAPFTIQDSGSASCATATSCSWSGDLSSQDTRSQTVQVRVGTTAISGQTLRASVSASASNDVADEGNTASVTTEISALPLPALSVGLTTQPQGVLTVGEQFVAFFDMTNTGSGVAESITATLEIPNDVTYVGGVAGGGQGVYDDTTNSVTWILSSLAPSSSANFGVTLKAPEAFGGIVLKVDATTQSDDQEITASDEIALHVTGDAVLDLQLSLDPSEQVLPGDALEMALQFQNIGSDTAFAAVVDTETPADTTLFAWPDYAQCTTGGAGGECTVGYAGEMRLPLEDVEAKENAVAII
ncbi:MAG: BspA family leucine-rich repeat surface protein, partial [Halieaceae bacterium]|nr:BspA family leucine-rich repeat surface protein [Halieaceae bacterium]